MNAEFSRLKYNNDSLQENVEVLRDENELLRDTMEVLTRKLEEYRANVCDLSKINCRKVPFNTQSKSDLPSFLSRIKDEEWINHLNLVHQITSISKPACDNIHYHDPTLDHNQPQPIPTPITYRKSSTNLKNRVDRKKFKNKQASSSDKFFSIMAHVPSNRLVQLLLLT